MSRLAIVAFALTTVGLLLVIYHKSKSTSATKTAFTSNVSREASRARAERRVADTHYANRDYEKAKGAYREFIDTNRKNNDLHVQDEIGAARIRLGYLETKEQNWTEARRVFLKAAREYKGTGQVGADFGGIPDQAAYHAAVCLDADDKKKEAGKAFRQFIKEHPLSPLIHAAFNRLKRLHEGKVDPEDEALLQSAVSKQESHIRFEISVCGPKAIAYMLPLLGKSGKDYKELAELCGTDDRGTSMEGMKKGLAACGIRTAGFLLTRNDFLKIQPPAIWLSGEHYLVITGIEGEKVSTYNPIYKAVQALSVPPGEQKPFTATVLKILSFDDTAQARKS